MADRAERGAAGTGRGDVPLLVLASASPRRAELLARLGLRPIVRPTDVDETPHPDEPAHALAVRLATAKAEAATARGQGDEVVLAADTVVALDDHTLGKPQDRREAREMLRRLSGRTHQVVTGVAVQRGGRRRTLHVSTDVTFRRLTDVEIAWYVATGEPDDKAGAYGIQGAGAVLVERIDGSDTNVIGLPLPATVDLLRDVGLDPLTGVTPP